MNINPELFWERIESLAKKRNVTFIEMCKSIGLSYTTFCNQRSKFIVPPKLEQVVDMSEYLGITADQLIYGNDKTCASPEALAVEESSRLQKIIGVLLQAPDKIEALETFLDIKPFSAGGGSTQKLRKAQM
jgi:transcriptional regulator with XRE-family HTH domain